MIGHIHPIGFYADGDGLCLASEGYFKIRSQPRSNNYEPVWFKLVGERLDGVLIEDETLQGFIRGYRISDYHIQNVWNEACNHPITENEYCKLKEEIT
ncbi:MAG: hypothetical protein COA78_22150 [Blastopirellula sp.]|nr:MAG: hypothetical protein COA78_22150 [Blastopirellula sp.]